VSEYSVPVCALYLNPAYKPIKEGSRFLAIFFPTTKAEVAMDADRQCNEPIIHPTPVLPDSAIP